MKTAKETGHRLSLLLTTGMVALLQCLVAYASFASEEPAVSRKYQITAGYLLHFTSYVRWPNSTAKKNINICIVGTDPFGGFIDEMLKTRPTNREGTPISAKRLAIGDKLGDCHLAFVTQEDVSSKFWRSVPSNHALLLVSDGPDFTKQGGMVSFYEENKRLRIEINLAESRKSNLDISSELLKIARVIKEQTTGYLP
jgi:hypothetical protein